MTIATTPAPTGIRPPILDAIGHARGLKYLGGELFR